MPELVASLKGPTSLDPWLVLHANDPNELDRLLDGVSGDLFAKVYNINKIFQNVQAVAPLAPSPSVPQSPSAAPQQQPATQLPPAQAAPWQAPDVPQFQPPAAQASTAPPGVPVAGLPAGVRIWSGPSSKNPQYSAVYIQYPFIGDAAKRTALREQLKNEGWLKDFDKTAKPWIIECSKNGFTEARAIEILSQYAADFE